MKNGFLYKNLEDIFTCSKKIYSLPNSKTRETNGREGDGTNEEKTSSNKTKYTYRRMGKEATYRRITYILHGDP